MTNTLNIDIVPNEKEAECFLVSQSEFEIVLQVDGQVLLSY